MGNNSSQTLSYGKPLDNDVSISMKYGGKVCFPPREGQSSSSIGHDLYIFGGVIHEGNADPIECDELLVFNSEKSLWRKLATSGDVPLSRVGATMSAVGNKLYLFGGLNNEHGWLDDVHVFDTDSNCWERAEVNGRGPSQRDKLCSTVVGEKIYLFGGFGPQNLDDELTEEEVLTEDEDIPEEREQDGAHFGWFNDLFIFDTVSHSWSNPMQMNLGVPSPRAAHAMCSHGKNIVIFGGRDSEARRNDIYMFDTETRKWLTFNVGGKKPAPRSFHSMTAVGNRMVVIGGRCADNSHAKDIDIFDIDTYQWIQPEITGDCFKGRGLISAALIDNKIYVYGGSSNFNSTTNQCDIIHDDYYYIESRIKTGGVIQVDEENKENIEN